jgi:hypothetical protein
MTNKYTVEDIKRLFKLLDLDTKTAAKKIGVSYFTVNSWLQGKRKITDGFIDLLIAKHLLREANFDNHIDAQLLRNFRYGE